ncbi:hypothetical protein BS17DRAFT_526590 [Gyrodon lividus]|nr:hypothetical protein BS17DRAFT_526590 [Gyrodon lividus]
MSQEMITDITLDHLPDLSESSVSFQIPPDNSSAEFLLDSTDGFDLLCRVTDDEASFVPPPYRGPPLMLSELTPKAESISRPPPQSRTPGPSSSESSQLAQPLALGNPSRDDCRKTPSRSRSKLMDIAFDSPVSEERREQLPAKVETFGRDHEIPTHVGMDFAAHAKEAAVFLLNPVPALRPKTELNPRTNSKPTVVDGGISKIPAPMKAHVSKMTKNKLSSVYVTPASPPFTASQSSLSQSTDIDTEKQLVPPASTDDDIRKPADNTQITLSSTSAMAERLVSYSQKLISSIGLYQPRSGNSFTEDSNDLASPDDAGVRTRPSAAVRPPSILLLSSSNYIPGANDEPLRLSEISPRKAPPHDPQNTSASRASQDGQQRAMSPMRPGKKRSSTGAGSSSQEYHRRKKGKTVLPSAEFERGSSQEEECSIAQPYTDKNMHHEGQPIMNSEAREDPRNSGFPKSTLPNTRTKYRPKLNSSQHKGPTLQAFPHLSNLRQVHGTITKGKGKYAEEQPKVPTTRSVSSLNSFSASSRSRHHPTKVEFFPFPRCRAPVTQSLSRLFQD